MQPKHKAIFLDRDGVINVDKGYVGSQEDIVFIDGLFDFCRRAKALGYLLIVVTNQSGIARGLFSEADVVSLMRWMEEQFIQEKCPLTAWYYCPHGPDDGCECRKPKPGMIMRAAWEHDIDPARSMMIGDNDRDIEAGKAARVGRTEFFTGSTWPTLR